MKDFADGMKSEIHNLWSVDTTQTLARFTMRMINFWSRFLFLSSLRWGRGNGQALHRNSKTKERKGLSTPEGKVKFTTTRCERWAYNGFCLWCQKARVISLFTLLRMRKWALGQPWPLMTPLSYLIPSSHLGAMSNLNLRFSSRNFPWIWQRRVDSPVFFSHTRLRQ